MPRAVFTALLVDWKAVLGVITAPSFVQVTLVAGPPVEVQVRVLDCPSNVNPVMLGVPIIQRTMCLYATSPHFSLQKAERFILFPVF